MDVHDELERLLQGRYIPPMRSNLPERIIEASLRVEALKKNAVVSFFSDFVELFYLPRPAFVLAMAVVVGVYIGITPEVSSKTDNNDYFMQAQIQADLGDVL